MWDDVVKGSRGGPNYKIFLMKKKKRNREKKIKIHIVSLTIVFDFIRLVRFRRRLVFEKNKVNTPR